MVNRTAIISEFGTGRFLGSNMYQQIEIQFAIFKPSLFWVPFVQLGGVATSFYRQYNDFT